MRSLSRALTLLVSVLALCAVTAAPASAADDYPWRNDTTHGADSYGFTMRQCVSFVAWRLAQRGTPLSNARDGWGDARDWDDAAWRLGHRIGTTPVVGAVAHWNARESATTYTGRSSRPAGRMSAGEHGHVAFVQHVHSDGSVTISHYNAGRSRAYSVARVRAPRYLYVGVRAPRGSVGRP